MKSHKIKQIIKKQGDNYQVVFHDGETAFWPGEYMNGIANGIHVREYQNKDGQTIAYGWANQLRFIAQQPLHIEESLSFVENMKILDRISFNNAVVRILGYKMDQVLLPDTFTTAHNIILLGLQSRNAMAR